MEPEEDEGGLTNSAGRVGDVSGGALRKRRTSASKATHVNERILAREDPRRSGKLGFMGTAWGGLP